VGEDGDGDGDDQQGAATHGRVIEEGDGGEQEPHEGELNQRLGPSDRRRQQHRGCERHHDSSGDAAALGHARQEAGEKTQQEAGDTTEDGVHGERGSEHRHRIAREPRERGDQGAVPRPARAVVKHAPAASRAEEPGDRQLARLVRPDVKHAAVP